MKPRLIALAIALAVPGAGCEMASHHLHQHQHAALPAYDMRDDASAWIANPNIHAYYQMTVEAFAKGPDHVDRAAFETRSHEIFRDLAVSMHMPPDALQEHLKAIPGEVLLIVTRDPHTLDSYDNFVVALFGPQGKPKV